MSPFTEQERAEIRLLAREEVKISVHEALDDYFTSKGNMGKQILFTTAAIVGALIVIGGGFKTVLAWIGFNYIK